MTAFKNRNGHETVVRNQADAVLRRRGRVRQSLEATALQSPASPVAPSSSATSLPVSGQEQALPATATRRRRTLGAATGETTASPTALPATATGQSATAQARMAPQSVDNLGRVSAPVDAAQSAAAPRGRRSLPPVDAGHAQTQAGTLANATMAAPKPAPTRQPLSAARQLTAPQATKPATNPAAQPNDAQLLAKRAEDRAERRRTRLVSPNMTWQSLDDVPKPQGPLNAQMLQVTRLIEVGLELAAMVEDENMKMSRGKVHMLSDHQAHKSELSSAYIQTMNALRAQPPALKKENMPLIQFMKDVATRVQTALDTHMAMCRSAMSMTEKLIGKIRKDVAAHDGHELQYKNPLLSQRMRRSSQERVSSVALNSLV